MRVPDWFSLVLLALAAFRTWRLIARDTILDWPRHWAVGLPPKWRDGDPVPNGYREHLAIFLECPYCAGFWVSLLWWGSFELSPHWSLIAAAPWAISASLLVVMRVAENDE